MNDESVTADREVLLQAIRLWLKGQKQKQQQQKTSTKGDV